MRIKHHDETYYQQPLLKMEEQKLAILKDVEDQVLVNSTLGIHHHVFQKVYKYEVRQDFQQLLSRRNKINFKRIC